MLQVCEKIPMKSFCVILILFFHITYVSLTTIMTTDYYYGEYNNEAETNFSVQKPSRATTIRTLRPKSSSLGNYHSLNNHHSKSIHRNNKARKNRNKTAKVSKQRSITPQKVRDLQNFDIILDEDNIVDNNENKALESQQRSFSYSGTYHPTKSKRHNIKSNYKISNHGQKKLDRHKNSPITRSNIGSSKTKSDTGSYRKILQKQISTEGLGNG